jgi:hypothetical protein
MFLKFAISEELNLNLSNSSEWLYVLKIIYQAVFAELEHRFQRFLDHLLPILRFKDFKLKSELLSSYINSLPPIEIPYVAALLQNMLSYFESSKLHDPEIEENAKLLRLCFSSFLSDQSINNKLIEFSMKHNSSIVARERAPW